LTSKTISAAQSIQKQIGKKKGRWCSYPKAKEKRKYSQTKKRIMNENFFFRMKLQTTFGSEKSKRKMQQEKKETVNTIFPLETTPHTPNFT